MAKVDFPKLIISIIIPLLIGFSGSIFTRSSIPWYETLVRPWFAPPNWVFGPVWTTLYILMGLSFYLVWVKGKDFRLTVTIFGIQLGLNFLWSVLFFGLQNPLFGLIEIIILWIVILINIRIFYGIDKRAAYLLIPYIVWVTVAAFLNYYIFILN